MWLLSPRGGGQGLSSGATKKYHFFAASLTCLIFSSPKRLGKGSRPDLPRRKAEEQSAAPPNTLNPWTALRKENTSFADILKKKQVYNHVDPVVASDKPGKSGKSARTEVKSGKTPQSAAGRRLLRKTAERKLDNAGICSKKYETLYWMTQKLPQICTVLLCTSVLGRLRDLQYIFAVTSGSPSIRLIL
mgnify:CR=1 FL=1